MSYGYSAPLGLFGHTQDLSDQYAIRPPGIGTPVVPGGPRSLPGATPSFWQHARTPQLNYGLIYLGKWADYGAPTDPVEAIEQIIKLANTSRAHLWYATPDRGLIPGHYGKDSAAELRKLEQDPRKDKNLPAYRPGPQPALDRWANWHAKWVLEGSRPGVTGQAVEGLTAEEIERSRRKASAVTELLRRLKAGTLGGMPPVKDDPLFWNLAKPALELAQIVANVRQLNGIMYRTIWPIPDDDPERWKRAAYIWTDESNMLSPAGWVRGFRTEYILLPEVKQAALQLEEEINHAISALNDEITAASRVVNQPPPPSPPAPKHDPGGTGSWTLALAQVGLLGVAGYLMYQYGYFGKVAPRRGRGRMAIPKLSHPKRGENIASFRVPT
jgi:hypothetical protein